MPAFTLAGSFVRIFYHSLRGSHVMTKQTRQWVGEAWDVSGGQFPRWSDDSLIDAPAMIDAFIDIMLPLYTSDVVFDSWILYNQGSGLSDPAIPVFAKLLTGKVGELSDTLNHLAWMKTFSFLTEDSHTSKIVLLDVPTTGEIGKTGTPTGDEVPLVALHMSTAAAWAGRDDQRPVAFRSVNNSVNKALERKYGF